MAERPAGGAEDPGHPAGEGGRPGGGRLFAEAATMARKGLYAQALHLLAEARAAHECGEAQALDLEARAYAQQGMLLRAEACWLEALRLEPGQSAYIAALAELRRAHDPLRQARARIVAVTLAMVVALAGLAGVTALAVGYWHARERQEAMAGTVTRLEAELSDLRGAVAAARLAGKAETDGLGREVRQAQADIAGGIAKLPGVTQVDERLGQVSAATGAAIERVAAEMKRRDELMDAQRKEDRAEMAGLVKGQAEIAAAMKADQEREALEWKAVAEQMAQNAGAVVALRGGSAADMDGLERRMDRSVMELRQEVTAVRSQVGRVLWFRWPFSKDEPAVEDAPPIAPTKRPAAGPVERHS